MIGSSSTLKVEHFGCFGKLPVSREFIVEGARDLSESGFDRWIGGGVGLAKARLGARFGERISNFPRYRFFWSDGKDRMLAGVICPSEDAAGRKHPFALFACVRGKQPSAPSIALQIRGLQEQAEGLLDSFSSTLSSTLTLAALREALRLARQEPTRPDSNPQQEYQRFLGEVPGVGFCGDTNEEGLGDGRFRVFQALVETLSPPRKGDRRTFRGGLRYPLAKGDSAQTALESCFWLDLTERCLGQTLGGACWLHPSQGTEEGHPYFFLFLTTPSDSQWISLVDPGENLESISYLDRPYGTEPPEQRMAPDLRSLLVSRRATFRDYLEWASAP
ncbi:type VI secretion system-associated protein TagF [Candidatus Eisenbacteria bacterium]|uniref:Type VI secretion system-associated protein TagF n=1 Tax=Eiseniibacteriota bacterium TaxID=2212470 RepID=A0ABV6YKE4_UNCEI